MNPSGDHPDRHFTQVALAAAAVARMHRLESRIGSGSDDGFRIARDAKLSGDDFDAVFQDIDAFRSWLDYDPKRGAALGL